MKNNKSQLDIFLLKRIEENREELRHNLVQPCKWSKRVLKKS